MEFSQAEKTEAAPITQQFFAQNLHVVGNVSGQAHVASQQSATMTMALDLTAVQNLVGQARAVLPSLPEEKRKELEPRISDLEQELDGDAPNQSKLRELMGSVRSICEGAAGNLGAPGILGLLKDLLRALAIVRLAASQDRPLYILTISRARVPKLHRMLPLRDGTVRAEDVCQRCGPHPAPRRPSSHGHRPRRAGLPGAATGLRRRSSIKLRIFRNRSLGTATSANWNVT